MNARFDLRIEQPDGFEAMMKLNAGARTPAGTA